MNWVLSIALLFTIVFLVNHFLKKRKQKFIEEQLKNNWGKKKESYYNYTLIGRYFKNISNKNVFHVISNKTQADLDLNQVFEYLDRTTSKIGEQYLYNKLRVIEGREKLSKFISLSDQFSKNSEERFKAQLLLTKLSKDEAYYLEDLLQEDQIKKSKWITLVYLLTGTSVVFLFLAIFLNPIWGLILTPILLVNAIFHYSNKGTISYYLKGIHQLGLAIRMSEMLVELPIVANHFTDKKFIKKCNKIKRKTKFLGLEKRITDDVTSLFWVIIEWFKIIFNIEYIMMYSFVDALDEDRANLIELFEFIGEIDSAISRSSLISGEKVYCVPTFSENKFLSAKEIIHPLIEDCVPNSFEINNESILLTGSNMSGKTTFIRTIAVNSVLAQTIGFCFAESYTAPFLKLFSSIRISDNLLQEKSYYLEEVLTIKEFIDESNSKIPCLFVLDEIFKGTNTIERISGGKSILSHLNFSNNIVIVSTHDIELTELLQNDHYRLFHFSEHVENNKLLFDHKLKNGQLKTRNAIKILELYDYPKEIISEARSVESTFGG